MNVDIHAVKKNFSRFTALHDVNLHIESGEFIALLGPSGSGKTTLLRIIAGLETADSGSIRFDGVDMSQRSAGERGVGFVFQHYALFGAMSVFENVAFGLRVRPRRLRPSAAEIRNRVLELLRLVQLEGLEKRFPSQLSGGQRQRVALARALAVEPKILLLDEPFGALDARVRQDLRRWLRRLHDELHITSIFVTHDQEEALEVADRIVIMNRGAIEQVGPPDTVYRHPENAFVMNFLGNVNHFQDHAEAGRTVPPPLLGYARPHELEITRTRNGETSIEATVRRIAAIGPLVRIELRRNDTGETLEAEITRDQHEGLTLQLDEAVQVRPRRLHVFPNEDAPH